jgi:diguanylate cyclase (GGDEF)-like protein/PAS domain S-box-containing protein
LESHYPAIMLPPDKSPSPDVYKTLLESTRAIPWKIDWDTMKFAYIGPQIESLLGWTPESWTTVQDWADRMHPDDRKWVVDFCVGQSKAGVDHEADYRALTKSGSYVWLRDVVHVVRRPDGSVEALVGFMFDISERKLNEDKLHTLQRELHDLSFKDALTGLGNRRRFDEAFEAQWARSEPLSVLLIDIDCFKQFNDHYGHVHGDACLRRVATALTRAATRPDDVLARFGGEEFAFILPNTESSGALRVAERCRAAVLEEKIEHPTSPVNKYVTISVGVSWIVPSVVSTSLDFLRRVDHHLYRAKELGRNRVASDPTEHPAKANVA